MKLALRFALEKSSFQFAFMMKLCGIFFPEINVRNRNDMLHPKCKTDKESK